MSMSNSEMGLDERIQRVETLIQEIEQYADPKAQAGAKELIQTLMDFHGAGLERIVDIVSDAGETGHNIIEKMTEDDLVNNLLLLYGLHPENLETRVLQGLDKVRPYLESHGGNVELLSVDEGEGIVRLRLQGSCQSCPSSSMTLKLAIEEAIYEAAPGVMAIETEGVTPPPPQSPSQPTPVSFKGKLGGEKTLPSQQDNGEWKEITGIQSLSKGSIRTMEVSGLPILFCRLDENFYAYNSLCPNCEETLDDARLKLTTLVCSSCSQSYDIIRAGRGLDNPGLHLEPFPLLVEEGRARIALPSSLR